MAHPSMPIEGLDQPWFTVSMLAMRLLPVFRLVIGLSFVATLATWFAPYHWLADLLANLRIQQCIGLIVLFFACLVSRQWMPIGIVSASLAFHLPWLMAAWPTNGKINSDVKSMTITLANVLTSNQRHRDIVAEVASRNPDVFVILELSSSLASVIDEQLASDYPHSVVRPEDFSNFGIGLYSRHPIDDSQVLTFDSEIETIRARVRFPSGPCEIFATHPIPPIGAHRAQWRNDHLEKLSAAIQHVKSGDSKVPIVLVGDLNLTPWSPHFEKLEANSGLRRAGSGLDATPTWYRYPFFPFGLVLDHALISDELDCVGHAVGPDIGSDHRTVTVKLVPAN